MSAEISAAFEDLRVQLVGLANETKDEAREKVLEFAALADRVIADVAAGEMSLEHAEEAQSNLRLATRSALVNQGYAAQARAFDAWLAGLSTALKLVVALA